MSDSLRPHELQHARPPCPSPTPRVHADSHSSFRAFYFCFLCFSPTVATSLPINPGGIYCFLACIPLTLRRYCGSCSRQCCYSSTFCSQHLARMTNSSWFSEDCSGFKTERLASREPSQSWINQEGFVPLFFTHL